MKKVLSVLLIIAALLGFYGGAADIKDVLACKGYWEEEGKKTTEDLDKLEDGLSLLRDKEEDYLDGKETLKEGEKTLADGEVQLADGEAKLASAEAEYLAAPAKLADAKRQLDEGEAKYADGQNEYNKGVNDLAAAKKKLSEGEDSIDGLTQLINGLQSILNGYTNDWKPNYEKLRDGRKQLYNGSKGTKKDLLSLAAFLPAGDQKAYTAAVNDVAGDDSKQTAKDYKDFIKSTNEMEKDIPKIQKAVKEKADGAEKLLAALNGASDDLVFAGTVDNQKSNLKAFAAFIEDQSRKKQYEAAIDAVVATYNKAVNTDIPAMVKSNVEAKVADYLASDAGKQAVAEELMDEGIDPTTATDAQKQAAGKKVGEAYGAQIQGKVTEEVKTQYAAGLAGNTDFQKDKAVIIGAMKQISDKLEEVNESVNGSSSAIKTTLLPGLKQFNGSATSSAIDKLSNGQDSVSDGVQQVASAVVSKSELKKAVKENMGNKAVKLLQTYASNPNPLSTKISNFGVFYTQMSETPDLVTQLKKALNLLKKAKAEGLTTLKNGKKKAAAGEKKLANAKSRLNAAASKLDAGRAQYNQGLADYAAAPGKIADGRAQLADAAKKLAEGRKTLADGKKKLAEYEDGEEQIREGLATLMASERYGDLKTILERRNGDDEFDDANNHLDITEGLSAVKTGREYQTDTSGLIETELTTRTVGSVLALAAAVLAVLAGILSLLKKYKVSGVLAVLTAVAGVAAIVVGTRAGFEMSSIAGSTIGATPKIVAGILAGVACADAVAQFRGENDESTAEA